MPRRGLDGPGCEGRSVVVDTREVLRVMGSSAASATAMVALYVTLEEFLRREHVIMNRTLGYQNLLVLAVIWLVAAVNRAWREWAE